MVTNTRGRISPKITDIYGDYDSVLRFLGNENVLYMSKSIIPKNNKSPA